MPIPKIVKEYELLVEFIELARDLGGIVVVDDDQMFPEIVAEAFVSVNQEVS